MTVETTFMANIHTKKKHLLNDCVIMCPSLSLHESFAQLVTDIEL